MNRTFSPVLAVALIVTIGYSFIATNQRATLNNELRSVRETLSSTQAELNSTQAGLSSTKQTLASTQAELSSTKQTLASTQAELSSTKQTLASTQAELSSTKQKLSSVQNDLLATKTKLDTIEAKLELYEDTMGTKIFSGVLQPPVRGAEPIELVNNATATNPTWQQLVSFLWADPTDGSTYEEAVFVSGEFGEMLHNKAEAAGIRAAWVGVRFEDKTGHGLNAFKTTNRGLVYVEPQSDYIAYVTKGKEYGTMESLGQNIPLDYAFYEKMKADRDSYYQKLEAYNRDFSAYNAVYVAEQRRRARLTFGERDQLIESLKERRKVLDSLRSQLLKLGEPMGIVKSIVIYW